MTGQTQWVKDKEYKNIELSSEVNKTTEEEEEEGMEVLTDEATGNKYFINPVTGKSEWF